MQNNSILTFHKSLDLRLSEHLMLNEIHCKCKRKDCITTHLDFRIIQGFEALRASCGHKPITITSAFRCGEHNQTVGGRALSRHLFGAAIDMIPPEGIELKSFQYRASKLFDYVQAYNDEGFIHCHYNRLK